jgi:hypothetical protein
MRLYTFNFKKMLKAIVLSVLYAAILYSILLSVFKRTWRPKENLYYFYQLENNSLDVINIGSSHVHSSINTIQLYQDYGIASYNLSAGSQPVWYSWYYLREAMKTQNPKVIVLDVYTLINPNDDDFIEKAQLNLLTMKPSLNKLEALCTSGTDQVIRLFLGFPKNHIRYRELNAEAYDDKVCLNLMGYAYSSEVEPLDTAEVVDVGAVTGTLPITEKSELYLRKILELCHEKDIGIVLVNAPWPHISVEDAKKYNYIGEIAKEYGVDFLNGCTLEEELGIDYTTDNGGDYGHLNYTGSQKWTSCLGAYLSGNYDLPDRRKEPGTVWEESARALENRMTGEYLQEVDYPSEYLEYLLNHQEYAFALIFDTPVPTDTVRYMNTLEAGLGEAENGYLVRMPDGNLFTGRNFSSDTKLYTDMYHKISGYHGKDEECKFLFMQFNSQVAEARKSGGIFFIVFDPFRTSPLDMIEFEEGKGYKRVIE